MSYLGSPPATQAFAPGTDTFNGDGSTVAFTLSRNVSTVNDIQVVVNNVVQQPTAYSVSVSTLTFTAAPSAGTANIYVRYLSTNLQTIAPQQGSVNLASFSATGTPSSSTYLRGDNTWAVVNSIPAGVVEMFAMNTAPTGWLKANGAAISRTTYSTLFAAIGTVFGTGDGSTTFNIPDLRGEFIRGWDDGRGVDPARAFGSSQTDLFKAHTHDAYGAGIASGNGPYIGGVSTQNYYLTGIGTTGGTETRPRNIALLACIKF